MREGGRSDDSTALSHQSAQICLWLAPAICFLKAGFRVVDPSTMRCAGAVTSPSGRAKRQG